VESNCKRLLQAYNASVVQYGCCTEFGDKITEHLRKHLANGKPGQFKKQDIERITKEIFADLSSLADNMDINKDPVLRKFENELTNSYRHNPRVVFFFRQQFELKDLFMTCKTALVTDWLGDSEECFPT
jgi:hypothetical protein